MTDSEKWAKWTLGVVALTIAAYFAFVARFGSHAAATAVFALLALTAFPRSSRRHLKGQRMDEREQAIAQKALLAGMRALWLAFIGLVLSVGFTKGWDASITLHVWQLQAVLYWSIMLLLGVEAAATLVLYWRQNA